MEKGFYSFDELTILWKFYLQTAKTTRSNLRVTDLRCNCTNLVELTKQKNTLLWLNVAVSLKIISHTSVCRLLKNWYYLFRLSETRKYLYKFSDFCDSAFQSADCSLTSQKRVWYKIFILYHKWQIDLMNKDIFCLRVLQHFRK